MSALYGPLSRSNQPEVGEVGFCLADESLPLGASHRRKRTILHGIGPLFEAGDELINVELGHEETLLVTLEANATD